MASSLLALAIEALLNKSTLEGKNLLLLEQILPFRVDLYLEGEWVKCVSRTHTRVRVAC